jgi:NADH-quinone oxidoreductase subunit B
MLDAFMELQRKIDGQKLKGDDMAPHLDKDTPGEYPVPEFGAHDLDPPLNTDLYRPPLAEREE